MHASETFLAMMLATAALTACQSSSSVSKGSDHVALGQAAPAQAAPAQAAPKSSNTATLVVHGMGCPQCASNVDRQLLRVPGVQDVKVDMGTGRVTVNYSAANPPSREQLTKAIEETGFTLVNIEM